ncbi:tyrosine-type recombinase/integrase [Formicincola oecophyllae]|uniref:Tyrosine-type recombinase/integrase n=1 Tax=Formicincola oecophyllae TaxID=2558361 RepID=A0A4Y6U9A4_9PROT|nr:site-specific integrase [Formicincola oecophyllae]QDH13037.1 tyrosine-type recombinase/integrase [Formicincola oecophyllae]
MNTAAPPPDGMDEDANLPVPTPDHAQEGNSATLVEATSTELVATGQGTAGTAQLTVTEREWLDAFARAALAPATLRAYESDARSFARWCRRRNQEVAQASAEQIAAWLAAMARDGLRASTISRARAGVAYAYRAMGRTDPNPARHEDVDRILAGIRRELGTRPERHAAILAEDLAAMVACCPTETLRGKRDAAMLAIGFMGAFRRSELVALVVEDILWRTGGVVLAIRRSKTDKVGAGQSVGIPDGLHLKAPRLLKAWLRAARIKSGPVFRSIDRWGHLSERPMNGRSVANMVKKYAVEAGLDADMVSGHSLRAGFITTAAMAGVSALKIADTSRHKSLDVLMGYVRQADLLKDNPGSSFA